MVIRMELEQRRRHALGALILCAGATVLAGERAGGASEGPVSAMGTPPSASAAASSKPLGVASALALTPPPTPLDLAARAPAVDVRLAPAHDGRLGAWLVLGPFKSPSYGIDAKPKGTQSLVPPPPGTDESTLVAKLGDAWGAAAAVNRSAPPQWIVASSNEGPIDLLAALKTKENDLVAYAAGTLHLERAGRFYLLVGADDGLRVVVDGKAVFQRDEFRPARDDDDMIALDLTAGDHALVLKLHQRDAAWSFHARILDAETLSAPVGAYLALPGTTADDARELATKMSWASIDRGLHGGGYRPKLTVRFLEGAPRGVPLGVRARLVRAERADKNADKNDRVVTLVPSGDPAVFDVDAGQVPLDASGAGELVVSLPQLAGADLPKLEDGDFVYDVTIAGRSVRPTFHPRRVVREAVGRADRALEKTPRAEAWLKPGSLDSVMHVRDRLVRFVQHGDSDTDALAAEARELDQLAAALEQKVDPYAARTGAMRRAYLSPADGERSEFGFHVPPKIEPDKKYPLIVALHGMNGRAMAMMRWLFGYDDPGHDQDWEDRHMPERLPTLNAFVIAPEAHGNAMYRTVGEEDVMRGVAWALANYPIDPQKVTITGPSMGGIGTAAIAFHHPSVFAAAEPLCGYHSYFIRRDYGGRPVRPWERLLAEERSNTSWAYNGMRIPLWIVHGKKDLPEANSGVLIDRYKSLGYPLKHDHPDKGHNVWSETYENLKGASWLLWNRRSAHPKSVRFKTVRTRFGESAWVHIDELAAPDAWGEVEARVRSKTEIEVHTKGVAALRLDRDAELLDAVAPVTVTIDGVALTFATGDPLALHHASGTWRTGAAPHDGPYKHGDVSGPIRDVFHAPLLFVYGADDKSQTRANEEVARAWAAMRWGVRVKFPVMSDAEFFAKGESLANDRALFLVGNAKSNRVVRELEPSFPIKIDGSAVVVGAQRFTGSQLGAAFVRPNPRRADRYVVVVEGVDALGTWRSLSLPELLPDFIVYDVDVAPARGQQLLSAGVARAAGLFKNDWTLPADIADPSSNAPRPGAKSEHDATPYLP